MKLLTFFIILILNLLSFGILYSESNITYLDLDKIISQSLAGKSISNQVTTIQNKNNKKLESIQKKLAEKEKSIFSQKNVLEPKEFNDKVSNFKKEVNVYQNNRAKMIREINQKKIKAISKLLEKLNPILGKYSNDKSISMIVQKKNIIIGKSELDITDDIMKLLNQEIKKVDVK